MLSLLWSKALRCSPRWTYRKTFPQIPLNVSTSRLTTLNTPFGLYKYNFLPFGLSCLPAIFQQAIDQVIEGLVGVIAYQDDLLVYSESEADHQQLLHALLDRLQQFNVRINSKKSTFFKRSIQYLGFCLSGEGLQPDPEKVAPIAKTPRPEDVVALRSFLGAVQYYSRFIPQFSSIAAPLYKLATQEDYKWQPTHQDCVDHLLKVITSQPVLKCFNPNEESTVTIDSSGFALGGVLEQQGRPVLYISRKLNQAELHYSQTQKEALAVYWGVKRLHKYLFGKKFKIVTDHKALTYIFHPDKAIAGHTTSMLTRWACFLSQYHYEIIHKSGVKIPTADFLSRYSYQQAAVEKVFAIMPFPIDRNDIIRETRSFYGSVLRSMRGGWSIKARRQHRDLFCKREDLSVSADGVLSYQDRIVIPPILRNDLLQHLHGSHLGRDKMLSMARTLCWWPELNNDVAAYARQCKQCSLHQVVPTTHTSWPFTYKPMQRIHVDYCGPFIGGYYALVIIDSYSKYPQVYLSTTTDASFTKSALRRFFADEGVPQLLVSDNGPQFRAELLRDWLNQIGVTQLFTPPRHPQSNGQAENFVKSLKSSVKTANPLTTEALFSSVDSFLLQYRSAEHCSTHKAPSVLFKGRTLRSSAAMDVTRIVFKKGNEQQHQSGIVIGQRGRNCLEIVDSTDGSIHLRHRDQVYIPTSATSRNASTTSNTAISSSTTATSTSATATRTTMPSTTQLSDQHSTTGNLLQPAAQLAESDVSTTQATPADTQAQSPQQPLRRSTREHKRPKHLEDFV